MLLALEACKLDLPMLLCQKLALLDFESRKDAAQVTPHHRLITLQRCCTADTCVTVSSPCNDAAQVTLHHTFITLRSMLLCDVGCLKN